MSSDSASNASSGDDDDWGKFPCSSALWKWRSLGPLAQPNNGSATSTRGGTNNSTTRSPQEKPQWPSARGYAQMAYHHGFLYLHGGQDTINEATGDTAHFRDLFAYDCIHHRWEALAPATIDRMAHSMHAVEFGGRHYLLVFGGFDPQGLRPELFDLQHRRWLQGPISICEKRLVNGASAPNDGHGNAIADFASTDILSRPPAAPSSAASQLHHSPVAEKIHHFSFKDDTNRYLHSSVQNRARHASTTSIYVFGGTDAQNGRLVADLMVVELTDTEMDDCPSICGNPCVAISRPACSGDAPSARLGHQACMLGGDAMLIYGGLDQSADVDGKILIFGGRQPDDGNSDDEANQFVDAFVGHITADIEPTDPSQLKHNITWRRAVSHDGPFPREYSDAAYCVAHALPSDNNDANGGADDMHGVRCYVFGGENSEGTCVDSLLELVVDANCLAQDDSSSAVDNGSATNESPFSDRYDASHVVVALADDDGPRNAAVQHVAGEEQPHRAQLFGLSNTETSIAMSVGSQHSTASPSRMANSIDPSANELLHALVDCVAQLNDSVRRGFEDLQARTTEIERRMGRVEQQLHAATSSNPSTGEQRLMNAAIRQSLGAIEKELGLRR